MSEFSDNMAATWGVSASVFGAEKVTINGVTVDVIEHSMEAMRRIDPRQAGRAEDVAGELTIQRADWVRCAGRQGVRFLYGNLDIRVMNDPAASRAGDILVLKVGPA